MKPEELQYSKIFARVGFHDGKIVDTVSKKHIPDVSIAEIGLKKSLQKPLYIWGKKNGNLINNTLYLSSVLQITADDIKKFQLKTWKTIKREIDNYILNAINDTSPIKNDFSNTTINDIHIPKAKIEILKLFRKSPTLQMEAIDIVHEIPDQNFITIFLALEELLAEKKLFHEAGKYFCKHRSFFDVIKEFVSTNVIDEKEYDILQKRITGKTLDEIGQDFDLTRENVRQKLNRLIQKVVKKHADFFEEDQFAYLFKNYYIPQKLLLFLTDDNLKTIYYLNHRYEHGTVVLEKAIDDQNLPIDIRRKIENWQYRNYLQIDNTRIPINRESLENIVIRKFCQTPCSIDDFFKHYNCFLESLSLSKEEIYKLSIFPEQFRSRENQLTESRYVLWSQKHQLRYYNIEATDFSVLLETLNLNQYQNIEISTSKFFRDYPELMLQYDIKNEYELHNLLKKLSCQKENPTIHFSKMPTIKFGNFDREQYVRDIMFQLAPISAEDLANIISAELGFSPATLRNWFSCIDEYYYQGQYSTNYLPMSEENLTLLKSNLVDDLYLLDEIKTIYTKLIPDADSSEISSFNLKKIGFVVNSTYAYKNHISAADYFKKLYCKSEFVDSKIFHNRFCKISLFNQVRYELEANYEIVEFEPLQYISIRQLEKHGIGKKQLTAFCNDVYEFVKEDSFFTIEHLQKNGFSSFFDILGLGPNFYASILKADKRFSSWRLGKNTMLYAGSCKITIEAFILDYMDKVHSININELIDILCKDYNVVLEKWKIIEQCNNTKMHYDCISGNLYKTYDDYLAEL